MPRKKKVKEKVFEPKYNKANICNHIAKFTGLGRDDVFLIFDAFIDIMKEELGNGNNIYLMFFGDLKIRRRKNTKFVQWVPTRHLTKYINKLTSIR